MRLFRKPVNKKKAARKFGHKTMKTKAANMQPKPMRGGYRL